MYNEHVSLLLAEFEIVEEKSAAEWPGSVKDQYPWLNREDQCMKERKVVPVKQPVEDQAQAVVFTPFTQGKESVQKECVEARRIVYRHS